VKIGPDLEAFLREVMPVIVGTVRTRDGTLQMRPVWYEYRDGLIWLNGGPNRLWVKRAKRTGRLALFFIDPKNMWRWVLLQTRLAETTADGADEHIDRLSQRYLGMPYRDPKIDRLIVKLEPSEMSGSRSWS